VVGEVGDEFQVPAEGLDVAGDGLDGGQLAAFDLGTGGVMKRWTAALGPLAVVCLLAACSSSSTAGTSPRSPSPFASQADQVMADLTAGNFTAVQAKFDPAMIQANQAVPLPKAWAACQDALGTYRSHDTPTSARNGQFDLEQVPVTWANGPGTVTITFNLNGTVAGLHCHGAPPS
jgi:FlaG/FlaF family flagellin (archaellin)